MSGYRIGPADPVTATDVYAAVGFRPDLVEDLGLIVSVGGSVFAATLDDNVVGVSSCLPFASTGWVGGVAVLPEHGRRGLGQRLTARAVAALHGLGVKTVLLHATEVALPMYARMGFDAEIEFVEFVGSALRTEAWPSAELRLAAMEDLDEVLTLDKAATGEDRSKMLRALWPGGAHVYDARGVFGYHLPQRSSAVGAVVASENLAGLTLLRNALESRWGRARVPCASDNWAVRDLLVRSGYTEHLRTTRMRIGPPVDRRPDMLVSAFNLYWG